ncbi:HIT family protein [Marinobacter caseinilyticus]|uniref:HIT family protein n=1 Tax=Marinobacter caseinilyticus TaxID=2692195 RepID=UPI00140A6623|nr:HIT family protein [Marinobacter caseinilyticus]
MACIFCQIAGGELPASIVYEDSECLAFMDIHPLGRGHVLVIPKHHARQVTELETGATQRLFAVAESILSAQRRLGWGLDGSHILLNDGKTANQKVPHVHVHIIPREKGDSLKSAGKLALHVTGVFGFATPRPRLEEQASQLRTELLTQCNRRQT